MEIDYLLFVFMVSLGVLQFVGARGRLEGISFFPRRYISYIFAALMVIGGYWWFFRIDRNIPDTAGGISGPWLFAYLVAGLAIAMVLTLLVSSAVKARWGRPDSEGEQKGLEVLKRMTFIQAIIRAIERDS